MTTSRADAGSLRKWYQEYMAEKGDSMDIRSPLITAVHSDHVDPSYFEHHIEQAMSTTHVSEGYCERCLHLFHHWPDLGTGMWTHAVGTHLSTEEIEAAARQGCKSCLFFFTRLRITGMLDTIRRIERRMDLVNESATASLSISNWTSDETQLVWFNLPGKIATHCNNSCAVGNKFQTHVVPPSTFGREGSRDPFDLAKDWLKTCSESHDSCSNEIQLKRPTRLLHVANKAIKLISTATLETLPRYATLSYCWGTEDITKSAFNSSSSTHDTIIHEDLPKTFRDAIDIVRKLGLDFIWIDALCIAQTGDNNEDWLRESGQMRDVYGGTYVNIAAATAKNVSEGCLPESLDYSGGFSARLETSEWGRVQVFYAEEVYQESTIDNHLATRAWALQEKLLAPRTIYWGDKGLFWECRTMTASQFVPDGFVDRFHHRLVRPLKESWPWFDIVRNYSKGNLTRACDKLTALSGIARHQHELSGEEYLAGMWREKFVRQLGWKALRKTKKLEWRAPTWSWMSVDGEVHYFPYWNHDQVAPDEYVRLLHASTSPAGPDIFGSIKSADLRLSCSAMVRGRYVRGEAAKHISSGNTESDYITLGTDTLEYPISLDYSNLDLSEGNGCVYLLPLIGGESGMRTKKRKTRVGTDDDENDTDDDGSDNWIVGRMIRGLVLQQSGPAKGNFERIGHYNFYYPRFMPEDSEVTEGHYHGFHREMDKEGVSTAQEMCLERLSDAEPQGRCYVITLD